jgi:uncharacterized protein
MDTLPALALLGLAVGTLYGLFGVGSAFATPALALVGIPGMAAVVGPLPGLLPGSALGAWSYSREGRVDWVVARRTLIAAVPAALVGALASRVVGGPVLLALSGIVLLVVGLRIMRTRVAPNATHAQHARRDSRAFVMVAAVGVGFAAGLLANGGGFLLVPMFLLALGLDIKTATGTSLVVAAALAIPTLLTHTFLGDIDWLVALAFAFGMVPGALLGARIAHRLPSAHLRTAFGVLLTAFALWFLTRQLALGI